MHCVSGESLLSGSESSFHCVRYTEEEEMELSEASFTRTLMSFMRALPS